MGDRLAVYGSLLSGMGVRETLAHGDEIRVLRTCSISGALIDLGPYPGLIRGPGRVTGELWEIGAPPLLEVLDDYEGFQPSATQASLFVRERVTLLEPTVSVWVYRYNGLPTDGCRVRCGCWRTHLASR
jgi:gamma-glutamylcyclotransferase (GGCT)/AIG2-like uncharacterized protein YtfP